MQQGSARPFAVKYMTVQGRRQSDHVALSSVRCRLTPGSDAAPEALKASPSEWASAVAAAIRSASSRVSCS